MNLSNTCVSHSYWVVVIIIKTSIGHGHEHMILTPSTLDPILAQPPPSTLTSSPPHCLALPPLRSPSPIGCPIAAYMLSNPISPCKNLTIKPWSPTIESPKPYLARPLTGVREDAGCLVIGLKKTSKCQSTLKQVSMSLSFHFGDTNCDHSLMDYG